jgi:ACS family tartrate transporter-like MFS transporter
MLPATSRPDLTLSLALRTRRKVTRRLMPFLFLLYVVAYIDRINISFAGLQMTGELGFSDRVFGLGSGIFFIGYVALGIPGALLVERWSARKVMAGTMLVWGCVASATGLIHTAPQFYAMRVLLGVTEAGFFPGMITYLGHWYRAADRAKAVAMFMIAIPASQVIASPISAMLMKVHWLGLGGWRWLLLLEGAPAVACGIASWIYLTDRPRQAHWLDAEERDDLDTALVRERTQAASAAPISPLRALWHRDVLLCAGAYFGGTAGNYGLSLWLPKMLQSLEGLTTTETTLLTAIPAIFAIPVMLGVGWNSDRAGERRWHAAIPRILAAMALGALAIQSTGVAVALLLFSIAFAGIVAAYPPLWAIPGTFLSSSAAAASIGLINSIGNLGGFAGPYLIGFFSDRNGTYLGGLWVMVVALAFSAVCVLLVRRRG